MPNLATPTRRIALLASAAALATVASGCVVAPVGAYPYEPRYGPTVEVAPPPPQVEVIPVAPGPAYVWIGGFWRWQVNRHVWIGGRWALPPRGGYRWAPGGWDRHGRGWRWRDGHWGR